MATTFDDLAILEAKQDSNLVTNADRCSISTRQHLIDRCATEAVVVCPTPYADSFAMEFGSDLLHGARSLWFHEFGSFCMNTYGFIHIKNTNGFMSTLMSTISERLRSERKRLGLSQGDFADSIGIHRNTQARYERGEREPDTAYLETIKKTGVDVGYVIGYSLPNPSEKLEAALYSYKVGPTGKPETDVFGNEIPGLEARFGGDGGIGWLFLCALGISYADWNRITEKLIRLDESGVPLIDGDDPAWGREIVQTSSLIQGVIAVASTPDSSLLAGVLEGVDMALLAQGGSLEPVKKAQAVAMLYRAFKTSGQVDQAMIDEAVKLAST